VETIWQRFPQSPLQQVNKSCKESFKKLFPLLHMFVMHAVKIAFLTKRQTFEQGLDFQKNHNTIIKSS